MNKQVSVIIPTYNRGHILEKTIPSYIQEDVGEVIVIDDCSMDNTPEVIQVIQNKFPIIRYYRLNENSKQTYAKNFGIRHAKFPYIYFGDDDSFIVNGSIRILLNELKNLNADIVGAKALYMDSSNDLENLGSFIIKYDRYEGKVVDLGTLKSDFTLSVSKPIQVPFTPACFIIKRSLAAHILFDKTYKGNCYREETDFLVRANQQGARIFYQPLAIQINLPRDIVKGGGSHSQSRISWYLSSIANNWRFLKKNYPFLKEKYGLKRNICIMQLYFISDQISSASYNVIKKCFNK